MEIKKRLLLLEDELLLRITFRDGLMEAGYEVAAAGSAAETRALLVNPENFDLLILNIKLPDGDGCDLCEEIRRSGVTCPILMQSGHQLDYKIDRALEAGVNAYLEKPFSNTDLVAYVKLLLDFPRLVSEQSRLTTQRGRNRPDVDGFSASMIDKALVSADALRPLPGTYKDHPIVDGKVVPTIPFTEGQLDEFRQLLLDIRRHLDEHPHDVAAQGKLIVLLTKFYNQLAAWLGGRATVVTDELLKHLVRYGLAAYVVHASGLKDILIRLILALTSSAAGH